MSDDSINLTGQWDGVFSYRGAPKAGPITPFVASMTENSGVIKGTIMEPNNYHSGTAHATMLGQRIGQSVHFAKDYHGTGINYRNTVLYFGNLSGDGNTITGEWQIRDLRGSFEMVREFSVSEPVEAVAAEEVDVSV